MQVPKFERASERKCRPPAALVPRSAQTLFPLSVNLAICDKDLLLLAYRRSETALLHCPYYIDKMGDAL